MHSKVYRRSERWCIFLTDNLTRKQSLMSYARNKKHPVPRKANLNYLVGNGHPKSLPYFQSIVQKFNTSMVRNSAMKTHGNRGPSKLDANKWLRLLTSSKLSPTDLCKMTAKLAIRIATSHLSFATYIFCRLIALDKCPSVRPIRIGEVLKRIFDELLYIVF